MESQYDSRVGNPGNYKDYSFLCRKRIFPLSEEDLSLFGKMNLVLAIWGLRGLWDIQFKMSNGGSW